MDNKKLVLVDGHSILNRAFYGMPDLTNSSGLHTGAVFGFLNILFKILDEERADYLTVAFDVHAPTFRHEVYKEYKGTRKPMPEELREQVPLVKKVLRAMGIQIREQAGLEADDILGTLARRGEEEGMEVCLLSGDRDLLQIATERTCVRIPKTRQGQTVVENYYAEDVLREYKVTPRAFIDVKALMGDSSDNVPGVPKVGEKTATQLIVDYGSVDGVYEHLDEIKKPALKKNLAENEDLARLSLFLVTIKTDCEISTDWEEARLGNLYTPEAFRLFTELNFRALLPRFDAAAAEAASGSEELSWRVIPDRDGAAGHFGELISMVRGINEQVEDHGQGAAAPLASAIGVYPVMDDLRFGEENEMSLYGAALCVGKKAVYIEVSGDGSSGSDRSAGNAVTQEELCRMLGELRGAVRDVCERTEAADQGVEPACLAVLNIKTQYPIWKIDAAAEFSGGLRLAGISDLLIECYLNNPLESGYQPEMIASEYLEESYPTWKQLFGKKTAGEAIRSDREELIKYACQMASVLARAAAPVGEKLTRHSTPSSAAKSETRPTGVSTQSCSLPAVLSGVGGGGFTRPSRAFFHHIQPLPDPLTKVVSTGV